jgi:hypothetical protein
MLSKVIIIVVLLLVGFVGYVATRKGEFRYERSGLIEAPAEKIFPYISNFKLGSVWSPYEAKDPNMKKTFSGEDGQVGSVMEFKGNMEVGAGKLELLRLVPNESVDIRLTMIEPFAGVNMVNYKLTPQDGGTLFTWSMSGNGGFMGKLMTILIDCEAMVGDQFNAGIASLKALVEGQKQTSN